MPRTVNCIKLGIEAEGLDRPPFPGELGQKIFEQVSRQAWQGWQAQQTRIINEYQLMLADRKARQFLMEQCESYFFGGGEVVPTHYKPA